MCKPFRRVIKALSKLGRTLKQKKISYQIVATLFILTVFFPNLHVQSQSNTQDSLYDLKLNTEGTVVEMDKSITIEIVESQSDVKKREQAEKAKLEAIRRRQVIARERSTARYQSEPIKPISVGTNDKRELVLKAATTYNIPWQILEAVWQIESGKSWDTQVRSYAGATGPMQFMPSTWRRYGVDANGDGVASINNAVDAVYSGARYLASNGANRGDIRNALYRYNHSNAYVNKVLQIAYSLGY